MIKKETIYKIGKIGKPHGVDGEVSFHFDDDIFDRVDADYLASLPAAMSTFRVSMSTQMPTSSLGLPSSASRLLTTDRELLSVR